MSNELFEAPPMGGEPAAYQDLTADQVVTESVSVASPEEKRSRTMRLYMMGIGGLLLVVLIILVIVLAVVSQPNESVVVVQPTSTPSPTPEVVESLLPKQLMESVDKHEQDLNQVDLQELDLSYPQLDWRIRY